MLTPKNNKINYIIYLEAKNITFAKTKQIIYGQEIK